MGRKKGGSWKNFKKTERVFARLAKTLKPVVKPIRKALVKKAVSKINRM